MPKIIFEQQDYSSIREVMSGVLDFEPTDAEIDQAMKDNSTLLADAAAWDWGDSVVRDELAAALDQIHNL